MSTPAKTVNSLPGFLSLINDDLIPGLALAAAQPHTEFTIRTAVALLGTWLLTSSEFVSSTNPAEVKSSLIGFTSSAGYILFLFIDVNIIKND